MTGSGCELPEDDEEDEVEDEEDDLLLVLLLGFFSPLFDADVETEPEVEGIGITVTSGASLLVVSDEALTTAGCSLAGVDELFGAAELPSISCTAISLFCFELFGRCSFPVCTVDCCWVVGEIQLNALSRSRALTLQTQNTVSNKSSTAKPVRIADFFFMTFLTSIIKIRILVNILQ